MIFLRKKSETKECEFRYNCKNKNIGTKKGEKIDFAIKRDGEPVLLMECKHWRQELPKHSNQLLRYYGTSAAKFAILTNGIIYRFYADLDKENVMDNTPFLEVDVTNIKETQIEEVKKFHKSYFNEQRIFETAADLKYVNDIKNLIQADINTPGEFIIRHYAKSVYPGQVTAKVMEYFSRIVKRAYNTVINDLINDRLKSALKSEEERAESQAEETSPAQESKIETTTEEIEAYYIVKAILCAKIPANRVTYRDAQTYFAIFLDNNNRKPICRLYLNSPTNKGIAFVSDDKKESRHKIDSLEDIYKLCVAMIPENQTPEDAARIMLRMAENLKVPVKSCKVVSALDYQHGEWWMSGTKLAFE